MKEVDILKLEALSYWKFERQHIMGAIECQNADVKTMTKAGMITETEVKVSIADMQSEARSKHYKHRQFRANNQDIFGVQCYFAVHYFYFLVPVRLEQKALEVCNRRYPYAGLLVLDGEVSDLYYDKCIKVTKPAKRMKRRKPDEDEIIRMGYAATNAILKYGNKLVGAMK